MTPPGTGVGLANQTRAEAPTGTVTVVLGDVAASTRLWQAQPEAMTSASRRVTELTASLAARHRGHLPREQGEGDNFVAAFAVASDAVAFAIALDLALSDELWPGDLTIAMRLGIHTGDVQWDADTGYLGPTFNRCARIRDLGHARQILLSQATGDIVADGLSGALALDDLGSHHLRDLSRAEHIFQLRGASDLTQWPPLKSVSSLPNNLPIPVTSLIGREEEIIHVAQLLIDNRLVTLTGAGGSGKTRLAQHVASEALRYAPDGAWWVDLMPLTEDDRVPGTIAEAVRLLEVTTDAQLAAAIGDAEMLLIIDNCEHLVDAVADTVDQLVHHCRNLRILATSRETIGIDGEHNVRVRPLAESEAAELFRERATAVAQMSPSDEDDRAIAEICRRLDGIPLAIELAAARTRLLSPRQIADGLDDRFKLLTSGARRARSRQRTLEASVAWSFDLLDEDEKSVLCRLGVHPAGFTLEGATYVGGLGGDDPAILDILTSLVEKSLVTVRPDDEGRRYRLLETIRQYGLERLAERGEAEAARDAHLDYVLEVMRDQEARLVERINDPPEWLRARTWLDDVRTAQSWAGLTDRPKDIIQLHWPNYAMALISANHRETLDALEPLLDEDDLDLEAQTRVHTMVISFRAGMGNFNGAAALTDEGVRLARELDDDLTLTSVLVASSMARGFHSADGLPFGLEALDRARKYGPVWTAMAGYAMGLSAMWGDTRAGDLMSELEETVLAARTSMLPPLVVMTQTILMGELLGQGRLAEAIRMSEATRTFARKYAPRTLPSYAVLPGVWLYAWTGQDDEAIALAEEAVASAGPPGTVSNNLALLTRASVLTVLKRDAQQAIEDSDTVIARLRGDGANFYLCLALAIRSELAGLSGDFATARCTVTEAAMLLPASGWSYQRGWVLTGRTLLPESDASTRLQEWAAFLRAHLIRGWSLSWMPRGLMSCAEALVDLGRHVDAARVMGTVAALYEGAGSPGVGCFADNLEDTKAIISATMDPQVFAEAFNHGRRLSIAGVLQTLEAQSSGSNPRPLLGWASLTPAEVDVARQVAEGLTNPEVAQRLFVSTNTVKTHLKSIYAKLDVSSRAALATIVAEQT